MKERFSRNHMVPIGVVTRIYAKERYSISER